MWLPQKMTLEKWTGHFQFTLDLFSCDLMYGLRFGGFSFFCIHYFSARIVVEICAAIGWNPDLSKPAQRTSQKVIKSGPKSTRFCIFSFYFCCEYPAFEYASLMYKSVMSPLLQDQKKTKCKKVVGKKRCIM
uniref:(northern house mosquito) hypothetical protein n=1 Tax=Culex pipiens TaxID=7175 RepID=A0A8D8H6K5_CULPI